MNTKKALRGANAASFAKAVDYTHNLFGLEFQASVSAVAALRETAITAEAAVNRVAGMAVTLMDF